MNITRIKKDNLNINILQTKKYKTVRIQVAFANHLKEDTITKRTLLLYMMKAITKNYPSRDLLAAHIEEMYAAGFGGTVKKIGLSHIMTFDLSIINNKYTINNEDLFASGLTLLQEILYNPLFTEDIMNEEKRLLQEYFDGIYANKMKYTVLKAFEQMFKDEDYRFEPLGSSDAIPGITLQDIQETYTSMIQNDLVNISVVGDVEVDDVVNKLLEIFTFETREIAPTFIDYYQKEIVEAQEFIEKQNVNQGKLVIGYRLNAYYPDDEYFHAALFNMILGGHSESLLFRRIREELGLVYSISSGYQIYKGIILIYAGINPDDYEKVLIEINKVITDIKEGNYDDQYLVLGKNVIENRFIESLDSNNSQMSRLLNLSLFDREFDKEDTIKKINSVTKEDVSNIATLLQKDTIYFLRNDNNEEN